MNLVRSTQDETYYVPELDARKVKGDRSLLGQHFMVKRYIKRVGYQFEPRLMPVNEVMEKENELLYDLFLGSIRFYFEDKEMAPKAAKAILRDFEEARYPKPTYAARGDIAFRKRKEVGEEAEWRRMWFSDYAKEFPYHEEMVIRLHETTRAITGKYYPPSGSYDDYDPGGIFPAFHNTLFLAYIYTPYQSGWRFGGGWTYMIYPDDLLPVKTDLPILE